MTSLAHVWFNAYFEGGDEHNSGVYEAEWDSLDGATGSSKKGPRAVDRIMVAWRYPPPLAGEGKPEREEAEAAQGWPLRGKPTLERAPGESVPEDCTADSLVRKEHYTEQTPSRNDENLRPFVQNDGRRTLSIPMAHDE